MTPFSIFLHPRRAAAQIASLQDKTMTLEDKLTQTLALLEQQRLETLRLTDRLTALSRDLIDRENRLAATQRDLAAARAELASAQAALAEQKSVDEKLADFNAQLTAFESLKRRYEKTIATLASKLRELRIEKGELRGENGELRELRVENGELRGEPIGGAAAAGPSPATLRQGRPAGPTASTGLGAAPTTPPRQGRPAGPTPSNVQWPAQSADIAANPANPAPSDYPDDLTDLLDTIDFTEPDAGAAIAPRGRIPSNPVADGATRSDGAAYKGGGIPSNVQWSAQSADIAANPAPSDNPDNPDPSDNSDSREGLRPSKLPSSKAFWRIMQAKDESDWLLPPPDL